MIIEPMDPLAPIPYGWLDPDNNRNCRTYKDADTCIRCGKRVERPARFMVALDDANENILPTSHPDANRNGFAIGADCAKRLPATHVRVALEVAG